MEFVAYRRASRLEVIAFSGTAMDWNTVETGLLACLRNSVEPSVDSTPEL